MPISGDNCLDRWITTPRPETLQALSLQAVEDLHDDPGINGDIFCAHATELSQSPAFGKLLQRMREDSDRDWALLSFAASMFCAGLVGASLDAQRVTPTMALQAGMRRRVQGDTLGEDECGAHA